MDIRIEKIVNEGLGFSRFPDGKPAFVYKSAPDDLLDVTIIENKKSFTKCKINKIIEPSPIRINPACQDFALCGGCDFQHISYDEQLKTKEIILKEIFSRSHIETDIKPIIAGSSSEYFYRNVIRFFTITDKKNNIDLAMNHFDYKNGLVPISNCLLQSENTNKILNDFKNYINQNIDNKSNFWQIRIREGKFTGDTMVEIITTNNLLPNQKEIVEAITRNNNIKSIYHSISIDKKMRNLKRKLIYGSPVIYEKIGKYNFQISPDSFFQTNSLGIETLYGQIKKMTNVNTKDKILDLYCGTGTIGIYLANLANKVTGVEIVRSAILDAKDNAKINKIYNIDFIQADATSWLNKNNLSFNKIIVDPPRDGLDSKLIEKICQLDLELLTYVSCNPATFARDIKIFKQNGFELTTVQPIDMFPQTHHLEIIGTLIKS